MENFLANRPPDQGSEEVTKTEAIDRAVLGLGVGEEIPYPISEKGTVSARVSDLNKMLSEQGDPRRYKTRSEKVRFQIMVVRET